MSWYKKFFINEAIPALEHHSGMGAGSGSGEEDHTYILVDEDGNEIPAVLTEEEVDLTATVNDIREGAVAVTDDGVIVGEKEIPAYHTYDGYREVTKGSRYTIVHPNYDYTELQSIICKFNKNLASSVSAVMVSIDDSLYPAGSTTPISTITKDDANGRIDFGLINDSDGICVLRYIMYKEVY